MGMEVLLTVLPLLSVVTADTWPRVTGNINPFNQFIGQSGPTSFRQSQGPIHHPQNFYPALPQFFQSAGQQPLVYHPNHLTPQLLKYGAHLPSAFSSDDRRRANEVPVGFNRGHVEFHPQREQVMTYTSFRDSVGQASEESTLMSRAAVESVPIIADAYAHFESQQNLRFEQFDDDEEEGGFDRGNVEAYPANPLTYYGNSIRSETELDEDYGYGSYGQAGNRHSVESRPLFTAAQDPAEAYPMPVQANSRPYGQISESILYGDPNVIGASKPRFYSPMPRGEDLLAPYKLICYYESWSIFRPSPQDFSIDRIDPFACTHIMYSFVGLSPDNYTIMSLNPEYDNVAGGLKSIVSLKGQNPDLKVMVAVGGWNEGGKKYSDMVTMPELRSKFVQSAVKFVEDNHFDGLDLNWEYPGASDRGGRASDKENFALLVKELYEEFKPRGLLLSAAVSPARFRINEGYDIQQLNMYLDFISVITYDLRGPWDGKADHNAPIAERKVDTWAYRNLNVLDGLEYWVEQGASPEKLILGVPFYGRSFTLADESKDFVGARIKHAGIEGPFTQEAGFLAYYEICSKIERGGWSERRDEVGSPYIVKGDQWIGYDDTQYISQKMELVKAKGYGGAMAWAIDLDDQLGLCQERWPLLSAIRKGLGGSDMGGSKPAVQPSAPEPEPEPEPKPTSTTRDTTAVPSTMSEPDSAPSSPGGDSMSPSGPMAEQACTTEGQKVAHPTMCTSYLLCIHKKYTERDCGGGLHWNDAQKFCDWPDRAKCKSSGGSGGSSSTGGGAGQTPDPVTGPTPTVQLETVDRTSEPLSGDYYVVCYFTNWAWYRNGLGKYKPEDIDPDLCTHIVYGFAVLDYSTLTIKTHDSWADIDNNFYTQVSDLRKQGKKVTLAIGGWNDSQGDKYSRLVNSPSARAKFITHVIEFIEKYNFDGLDLDWEYPKCWQVDCKKGPDSDKQAFADWVRELSAAFRPKGLLLSAAVSPSKKVVDAGYDVSTINHYLDWIAVMTYDYHGQWDKKTGHVAPMYQHPEDDIDYFNMDFTIRYWLEKGATRDKLVLGMPMYGQSFTLNDPNVNGLNAPARTGGSAGEFTKAKGFLAYYEICNRISNQGWTVVKDPQNRMGPYAYKGNQWVGFDDVETIRLKSDYIRKHNLLGGMIWALDLDDFRNRCNQGHHPLLSTIKNVLAPPRGTKAIDGTAGASPPTGGSDPGMGPAVARPSTPPDSTQPEQGGTQSQSGGDTAVSTDAGGYKIVCYFTNWAWYRQGEGRYLPEDIDASLCTHIVYGFAVLDSGKLIIKPHDKWADFDNQFYEKVTAHKSRGVKVLIAIGGWNDSAGSKYSRLVNSPSARAKFTQHVTEFIIKHNFDGLDLDWEYPKCWQVDCKKGPASDKEGFSAWIKELYEAFQPHGLLLSAAVSPSNKVIDAGYDVPVLSDYLDWIAVMTYDYHGQWDKKTGHVAPMYMHPEDDNPYFNTNATIHYWIDKGAERKKLVLGMPMYGQSFTLAQSTANTLNQKTYGGGEAGRHTRARGFLSYYEICYRILNGGYTVVRDPLGTMGPYAYRGNQWVGFDDIGVIAFKTEYIKELGLGGGMIWALDLDDFQNRCGCGKYPLLNTINRVLRGQPGVSCPVLGGDEPSKFLDYRDEPYDRITTTTTLRPWERPSTSWTRSTTTTTTRRPTTTTRRTRPTTTSWTRPTTTTRAPWLPKSTTAKTPSAIRSTTTDSPSVGGRCSVGEYKSHETDCNKFYQCDNGKFIERKCLPGLHWFNDRCVWPEKSDCTSQPTEATTKPVPSGVTAGVTKTTPRVTRRPTTAVSTVTTTRRPPPVTASSDYKVVCYFTNWAWYRQGVGKYKPEDIDPDLCTHIVYGFAVLDGTKLIIKAHDAWADFDNNFYEKVTALKSRGVKVLIAIGGWNDSAGSKYSRLVNSPSARAKFTQHVTEFIIKHNFDGLDLDWEYPKCWQVNCKKGPASDKPAFSAWIRELYEAFQPHGLLLSAAVSPNYKVIDAGYEVPELNRYLDWIAVMTYDYHGHWDKKTGHVAPMFDHPESPAEEFNANYTIHYWLQLGADRKKLVVGMPLYGQAFGLSWNSEGTGLNEPASKGQAGPYTRAAGFLAYYEICYKVLNEGYTVVKDPAGAMGPYAYKGKQWVGYDDVAMIRYKSNWIKEMGLGGGMIWALDLDDFRNRCGCEEHPLLRTINRVLRGYSVPDPGCTI